MISWIKGIIVDYWQTNNKFFILINCRDLGYEVQVLETTFTKVKTKAISKEDFTLWIKHIKKEESDSLFGFLSKDQKDFFTEILNVRGVGSQIAMSLLGKFSTNELVTAINKKEKKLISSVPGIGQKMTERLILELGSKLSTKSNNLKDNSEFFENKELNSILKDLEITLYSLNYQKKEIKWLIPVLINQIKKENKLTEENCNVSFEYLLKFAMDYLNKNNSNLGI